MINQKKVIAITSLGGMLEAYDFTVYAHMAAYISLVFFPDADASSSLLKTFSTFAVGYLARPLGALVFSHFGDRVSRKACFATTIILMAIATLSIGFLPGYAQLGVLAPILLCLFRFVQGFSFAGEFPGAFTYLYESVPKENQGLALSVLGAASLSGILLGVVVHGLLIHFLSTDQVAEWGWRIPFIFGGSIGLVSYVIRKRLAESSAFQQVVKRGEVERLPIATLCVSHWREMLVGLLLVMPVLVTVSLLILFIPGYLTRLLNYPAETVAFANSLSMFAGLPVCILVGALADRFDRRYVLAASSAIVLLGAWPLFSWLASGTANLYLAALAGAVMWGSSEGITLLLVVSSFPTALRYTGMATVYNLGATLFAGFAPVIAMGLIQILDDQAAPALFLALSGLSGLLAALLLKSQLALPQCPRGL